MRVIMVMTGLAARAGDIGVAALDAVGEAVVDEEFQRAIDADRGRARAVAGEAVDHLIGARRHMALGERGENLAPLLGEAQARRRRYRLGMGDGAALAAVMIMLAMLMWRLLRRFRLAGEPGLVHRVPPQMAARGSSSLAAALRSTMSEAALARPVSPGI